MNDHTDVTSLIDIDHFALYLSSAQHLEFSWKSPKIHAPSGSHKRGAKKVFAYEQPHCEALCAKLAPVLDRWTPRPTPFKLQDLVIRICDPKHPSAWRVCPSQIGATREWRADKGAGVAVRRPRTSGAGHFHFCAVPRRDVSSLLQIWSRLVVIVISHLASSTRFASALRVEDGVQLLHIYNLNSAMVYSADTR